MNNIKNKIINKFVIFYLDCDKTIIDRVRYVYKIENDIAYFYTFYAKYGMCGFFSQNYNFFDEKYKNIKII